MSLIDDIYISPYRPCVVIEDVRAYNEACDKYNALLDKYNENLKTIRRLRKELAEKDDTMTELSEQRDKELAAKDVQLAELRQRIRSMEENEAKEVKIRQLEAEIVELKQPPAASVEIEDLRFLSKSTDFSEKEFCLVQSA